MIALGLLCAVPVLMWLGQTFALLRHGMPVRWRIDARNTPSDVRAVARIFTQGGLVAVIVVYPWLAGDSPVAHYRRLLPTGPAGWHLGHGMAVSILFLCVLFIAWILTDCIRIELHQSRRRWMRRLALLLPMALLGGFVEELLFRGVLMADLLRTWPNAEVPIIGVTGLVYATAHYVRRVKRYWTFPGHFMLGVLLSTAFLETGTLWLPIGLHAGGNLMIMGTRAFFRYRGPAWVTGASVFPYAGAVGLVGLSILTWFVLRYYGAS